MPTLKRTATRIRSLLCTLTPNTGGNQNEHSPTDPLLEDQIVTHIAEDLSRDRNLDRRSTIKYVAFMKTTIASRTHHGWKLRYRGRLNQIFRNRVISDCTSRRDVNIDRPIGNRQS